MAFLRSIASQAIGLNSGFSLVRDFFGYRFYDSNQRFYDPLSLRKQMTLVQDRSIHISIILVGLDEDFEGASVVTRDQINFIQMGIQYMRDIYAKAPLGVRKLYWLRIGVEEAGSFLNLESDSEAQDLTDGWSGDNDGIDCFFVQNIIDDFADGWSNMDGPCDKNETCGLSGAVMGIENGLRVLIAHEVGHYLGLGSGTSIDNFMGLNDSFSPSASELTPSQAVIMRSGCNVKEAL
jgi:hypothetical protein